MRPALLSIFSVLSLRRIENCGLKILRMVNPATTCSLCPKSLTSSVSRFQMSCAPCLELVTNNLRLVPRRCDHDMNMVCASVANMQKPGANFAVSGHSVVDDLPVRIFHVERWLQHVGSSHLSKRLIGWLYACLPRPLPPTLIPGQPRSMCGPCDEVTQWLAGVEFSVSHIPPSCKPKTRSRRPHRSTHFNLLTSQRTAHSLALRACICGPMMERVELLRLFFPQIFQQLFETQARL